MAAFQPSLDSSRSRLTKRNASPSAPPPPSSSSSDYNKSPPYDANDPSPKPGRALSIFAVVAMLVLILLQFTKSSDHRSQFERGGRYVYNRVRNPLNNVVIDTKLVIQNHVNVVSWMDCLDLRHLAVLVNSTVSKSRSPGNVSFHFFIPGQDDRQIYFKLKLLFPEVNLEVIRQEVAIEKFNIPPSDPKYALPIRELAPFVISKAYTNLKRFIYIPSDIIMKTSIEELWELDLGAHAVGVLEDCSANLGSLVNFDVLSALQRSVEKPWISSRPYDRNACLLDINLLLVNGGILEKEDILEAILWWSKVFESGESRGHNYNLAVLFALHGKYSKLPNAWKIPDSIQSRASVQDNRIATSDSEAKIIWYDGVRKQCCGRGTKCEGSGDSGIWKQYIPSSAYQILDY